MNEEIKTLLEAIKSQVLQSTSESKSAVEAQISAFEAKMATTESVTELKAMIEAIQLQADNLDAKLNAPKQETKSPTYIGSMVKSLTDNFETIKNVAKGRSAKVELKTVGDMTQAANLTGENVHTYQPGVAMVPSQKVNFADLVPTVNSATGTYVLYRETTSEGGITSQTEGSPKSQIDYDLAAITYNATYISGYARYAKQMAQDLPFLTSFLPNALRRDYWKAENSIFNTAFAAAIPTLTTVKVVTVEKIIDAISQLETLNYDVNGIVVTPAVWAEIALTKSTAGEYSIPGVVTLMNGQLALNGVPVYKASWVPANTVYVGDWTQAKKVLVDGLAVEFFEQDADNVTKNLITARVESRTVLAIDRTDAFFKFTITPVSV